MGLLVETKHGCQTIHDNILMRLPTNLLTLKQELSKKQTIRKALSKRESSKSAKMSVMKHFLECLIIFNPKQFTT